MEFNSAFTDSFCNFHISSSKYAEIKTIKINMYPFFLYHRMISYKYKFSKAETFILKRLAQSFKGAIT